MDSSGVPILLVLPNIIPTSLSLRMTVGKSGATPSVEILRGCLDLLPFFSDLVDGYRSLAAFIGTTNGRFPDHLLSLLDPGPFLKDQRSWLPKTIISPFVSSRTKQGLPKLTKNDLGCRAFATPLEPFVLFLGFAHLASVSSVCNIFLSLFTDFLQTDFFVVCVPTSQVGSPQNQRIFSTLYLILTVLLKRNVTYRV